MVRRTSISRPELERHWICCTEGSCYLDCHGKNLDPENYTPVGEDDDLLIIP